MQPFSNLNDFYIAGSLSTRVLTSWIWVGFSDRQTEGRHVWGSTGEPISYNNWHTGEPSNGGVGGNEDCGAIFYLDGPEGGRLGDAPCNWEVYPFCEISPWWIQPSVVSWGHAVITDQRRTSLQILTKLVLMSNYIHLHLWELITHPYP